jgi:hypothetical protein
MRVRCTANTGKVLTSKYLSGNTKQSVFHVTVEKEYLVFAIAVYRGATLLLLSDDNGLPNWYPIDLFTISDAKIPPDWFSAIYAHNEGALQFLQGYERIVKDESHYDALLERSEEALVVFEKEREKRERHT